VTFSVNTVVLLAKTYASKDAIGTQSVQMLYNVLLKLLDR